MSMSERLNTALYTARRSAIREFSRLARETPGCISLTLGEPDFDTPGVICAAVGEAFDNHETHYIENNGSLALREAIAAFERERHGLDYSADDVIVTIGATEALFTALFGIINPGDEVIVPTPAFVLYEEIINLCRGVCVRLDTTPDGFQIDGARLRRLITPKTKAIILNSPNNPTGCVYTRGSLEAVRSAVAGREIFVLCDDVYRELAFTEDYRSFAGYRELRERILVVQSFSKPYAMTGWRVGYLLADASVRERLELVHQFAVVSSPAPFQRACIAALGCDVSPLRESCRARCGLALRRLREMGLEARTPEGAFYVFPSIARFGLTSAEFCRRMIREALVAATPGSCFGAEGFIRISCAASEEQLREGLKRLEKFIRSLT